MQVVKRDGKSESVDFNKVLLRIRNLCALESDVKKLQEINPEKFKINRTLKSLDNVHYEEVAREVIHGIKNQITTTELDDLAAKISQPRVLEHPDYGTLAARIIVSNYHKNNIYNLYYNFRVDDPELTPEAVEKNLFYYTARALYENLDANGEQSPLISPIIYDLIISHRDKLESLLDYTRDFQYDFAGFMLMQESYLLQCTLKDADGKLIRGKKGELLQISIERPQHMIMRVALGIHCSSEYVDWKKRRINSHEIWNTVSSELYQILNNEWDIDIYEKIKTDVDTNSVDWQEVYELTKMPTLNDIVKKYTQSWDAIAFMQDANLNELDVVKTYDLMSNMYMTHATPTLYNCGTLKPQLSSCYLIALGGDSMKKITKYWGDISEISKWAGGIGSHIHNLRSKDSYIRGTNGHSNGSSPMLQVVDKISLYVDQGGGKRPGSHAVYVGPEHPDINTILDLKKQRGNENERAKNLFYAMWIQDEFMRTVTEEQKRGPGTKMWYLMCPDQCPGLSDVFDEELRLEYIMDSEVDPVKHAFTHKYRQYINAGKFIKRVSAVELWKHICELIEETGVPYITYKDAINRKSNQKALGTIKSSNLCSEIVEFSDAKETAVCNLVSISLSKFVVYEKPSGADKYYKADGFNVSLRNGVTKLAWFDFDMLKYVTGRAVYNLNQVIDINYYPTPETYRSNMKHRPIGIGIQGLADLYTLLRMSFDSPEANELNFYVFEMMYYAALEQSNLEATVNGTYFSFKQSPLARGEFQFDLWEKEQKSVGKSSLLKPLMLDWKSLREKIMKSGTRNSLLLANMPTGSTSTLMGNSPCIEPHSALCYKRKNKAGEFTLVNKYLINDLVELGLWNPSLKNAILASSIGSIAQVNAIPLMIRNIYKTVWEVKPNIVIDQALTRGPFIDQTQSMNLFIDRPTHQILTKLHFYSWRRGIKTGSYYTRRLAGQDAQKIQVTTSNVKSENPEEETDQVCTMAGDCKSCSA
jgi:ribonucleoside-diphosphate reductase alpha subunit